MERQIAVKTVEAEKSTVSRPQARESAIRYRSTNMQLQIPISNRALGRFLQTRLTVGTLGDCYEQEADRVADQVMRMPDPTGIAQSAGDDNKLRRNCTCGGSTITGFECEECKKRREGNLQRVATQAVSAAVVAPPTVHEVLRSPGQPLDAATRAFFEPRFGHDFGKVRIHTDKQAAESARALNANAYTVAGSVVFANRQYAPGSANGRRLLAHELSHVIQQGQAKALTVDPLSPRVSGAVQLSRSPPHQIACQTDDALNNPLYPLQAGCVAQQACPGKVLGKSWESPGRRAEP